VVLNVLICINGKVTLTFGTLPPTSAATKYATLFLVYLSLKHISPQFYVPGVVVPLIATVGINNKVTFLEKGGTGFPNSTGAYELDLSLVNGANWENAWRGAFFVFVFLSRPPLYSTGL
jgi:hypothetical protein